METISEMTDPVYRVAQKCGRQARCAIVLVFATLAVSCASSVRQPGSSAAESAPTPAATGSTTVYWRQPNNPNIYGYDIYRSESEDGPFVKVNAEIIRPEHNTPNQQYTDRGLVEGKIYYYYIEVQYAAGGAREKLTPVTPVIVGKPWEKVHD